MKIQPPCDERDIDRAEQSVGIPFPKELRALLKELNGDRYLLLSVDEIMKQSELNRQVREQSCERFGQIHFLRHKRLRRLLLLLRRQPQDS